MIQLEDKQHGNKHTIGLLADRLRLVTSERDRLEAAYKSRIQECEQWNDQVTELKEQLKAVRESHSVVSRSKSTLENTVTKVCIFCDFRYPHRTLKMREEIQAMSPSQQQQQQQQQPEAMQPPVEAGYVCVSLPVDMCVCASF